MQSASNRTEYNETRRFKLKFQPRQMHLVNELELDYRLPLAQYEKEVAAFLRDSPRICSIEAGVGSGKSTLLPMIIYKYFGQRVVVTQPRRIAAVSLAQYTKSDYVVRFERQAYGNNHIYMTDGSFLKNCAELEGFWIVVDEAHERSAMTDVVLGFLQRNPRFKKVVIASACSLQRPNTLIVPGIAYPVSFIYLKKSKSFQSFAEGAVHALLVQQLIAPALRPELAVYLEQQQCSSEVDFALGGPGSSGFGNVLVFLPGYENIYAAIARADSFMVYLCRFCTAKVLPKPAYPHFLPLHATLSLDRQKEVFTSAQTAFSVIFSTNVAETSLTLPDIGVVVDSAMYKTLYYDAVRHCDDLVLERISRYSLQQRAGRAGRVRPGYYLVGLTEQQARQLAPYGVPELRRRRLEAIMFELVRLLTFCNEYENGDGKDFYTRSGRPTVRPVDVKDIYEYPFPEPPLRDQTRTALTVLERLRFLEIHDGTVCMLYLGEKAQKISLDPELAFFLLNSGQFYEQALRIAAFLAAGALVGALVKQQFEASVDEKAVDTFFDDFELVLSFPATRAERMIEKQLSHYVKRQDTIDLHAPSLQAVFALALQNVAYRRPNGLFRTAGGYEVLCRCQARAVCFNNVIQTNQKMWLNFVGGLTALDLTFLQRESGILQQ